MAQDETATLTRAEPIIRRTLHDELLERLRQMIIDGDLTPGSKVPEKDLCARFGVSRTPLREALKVLANEGLVTLTPNRGAMIADLTLDDLEETFPVMGALEALSGEMACANITDAEIAEIRKLHEEMVAHYKARALHAYFRTNQKIHERILSAANNQTLSTLYRGLEGRIRQARYIANMSDARWAQAVEEHAQMLDALEARDGVALAAIMKRHLENKFETVKEALLNRAQD
ncbi:MAG: GntR family transcriptional regulator [Hyphomicrobiaceae bacterium]|nr:GntR family transcriptional regulator [Hyphomicrobiaceae bacterium]